MAEPNEPIPFSGLLVPDPTKLTTDAVNAAKDDIRRELAAAREVLETRIASIEASFVLRWDDHERDLRASGDQRIALKELLNEKFTEVELRFKERDVRFDQSASANKAALDAALSAAKELVAQQNTANSLAASKSEASFTKQLDAISIVIATTDKAQSDRLLELKERIDRGDGQSSGVSATEANMRAVATARQNTMMVALFAFSALLGAIGVVLSLIHHP